MKIIVQKYGGTSVDSVEKRESAAQNVKTAVESGYSPVVVVSAMGRFGKPYATDTLLEIAENISAVIHPREKDLLMSCGEIISTVIMVQTLKHVKLDGCALTGAQAGIITNNTFGNAKVDNINPENILKIIEEGKIPVVAGFQGITEDGEITTLGRGGSDTTASVLAAALEAYYIEIYTDVDGVMTADPNLVKNARILDKVSYNEVCELAYQGARVIHPRAAEIAMREGIPIKVKSIFSNNAGTLIHNQGMRGIKSDRVVTGVTSRENIVFLKIIPKKKVDHATGLTVFNLMSDNDISVDFINIRPEAISFIVKTEYKDKVSKLLKTHDFQFEMMVDFVKVSIVGGGMTGRPGVMATMVNALTDEDIEVYQTTDSHTTISCLIKKVDERKALNALHNAFKLED
ncbi:MAG: aspartate kinase [Halothermotrichaceae bacterium]